jgi:hypothetical protein
MREDGLLSGRAETATMIIRRGVGLVAQVGGIRITDDET